MLRGKCPRTSASRALKNTFLYIMMDKKDGCVDTLPNMKLIHELAQVLVMHLDTVQVSKVIDAPLGLDDLAPSVKWHGRTV